MRLRTFLATAAVGLSLVAAQVHAAPLRLELYNPGSNSVFAVSSSIISSEHQILLVDAQFQRDDAQALVDKLKAYGKELTYIYISQGDPDYYFGLDLLKQAFPKAKIIASAPTVAAIKATGQGKLAYWGPILKGNAPKSVVIPEAVKGSSFQLEGQTVEIHGLDGPTPGRTFLWIPAIHTVTGGVLIDANQHVWMADTPTHADRLNWLKSLDEIEALKPGTIIPGHFLGDITYKMDSVRFTREYIKAFDDAAAKAKNASELINAMKVRYPNFTDTSGLELGAKVSKGEMKWPAN